MMKDQVSGGPASRLTRWALKLAEYNFEVEHKPGASHCDADAISRLVAAILTSPGAASRSEEMYSWQVATVHKVTTTNHQPPPPAAYIHTSQTKIARCAECLNLEGR
eukprot:scaffold6650_cov110-Isochrysis_galbana.AAC.3